MAKATFEGQVIRVDKKIGGKMSVISQVDFVLMVRHVTMDLPKHKEDKNYWKPVRFDCPARAPYKLQRALVDIVFGDYVIVKAEKDANGWKVTDITFEEEKAEDFKHLLELNESIL